MWIGLLAASILLIEFLFDPILLIDNTLKIATLRRTFPDARSHWQSLGITSYPIDIKAAYPPVCWFEGTIRVHHGEFERLVHTEMDTNLYEPNCPFSDLNSLTISQVFEDLENRISGIDICRVSIEMKFDPTYHFISHYRYEYGYRIGLFTKGGQAVGDYFSEYTFSNFQIIDSDAEPD